MNKTKDEILSELHTEMHSAVYSEIDTLRKSLKAIYDKFFEGKTPYGDCPDRDYLTPYLMDELHSMVLSESFKNMLDRME